MNNWKRVTAILLAAVTVSSTINSIPMNKMEVQAADNKIELAGYNTSAKDVKCKYLDDNTDPSAVAEGGIYKKTSWTELGFDDSNWKESTTGETFGAKNQALGGIGGSNKVTPTVLLTQKYDGSNNIPTYFFRTEFNVDKKEVSSIEDAVLKGTAYYDDGAIIYLNGEKVGVYAGANDGATLEENMETNLYYGGLNEGSTDVAEASFSVDAEKLKDGENVLSVEVHQAKASSSDIYYALKSLTIESAEDEDNGNEGIESVSVTQKAISLTVGADEKSRNISWYADTQAAGTVQYAVKSGEEFPANYKEVSAVATAANDSGFYSNHATMDGLSYNTEYVYRLVNGETVSETYSFKTTGENDFSFLLVGDPQIGASRNATNDAANWRNTLNTAFSKFPESAFLLSAGDQVNTASNETEYAGYLESDVLKSLTTATVIGNHDSGSNAYSQHFNNPNVTAYGKSTAGTDYWFVYNNVLVMSVNSNWSKDSVAEHKAFMKEAIEANPDVDWKVVTFHHSIYSAASHAVDKDILSRRNVYVPVFTELDIDAVLMGHDHVYVRSFMMDKFDAVTESEKYTDTNNDGVPESVTNPEDEILYMTVNSASGSKYYNLHASADTSYSAVKNQERTPNFSNIEVTENSFKVSTYRTTDLSVVDEFTIYRETETTKTVEAETKTTGFENKTEGTSLAITKTAGYNSGVVNEDGGSAEIIQYNSDNKMYYVVNGTTGTLDIVPRKVYTEDNKAEGIKFDLKTKLINYKTDFEYGDMTSVAVNTEKDLIAIAVQAVGTNDAGLIVLMNYDHEIVAIVDAGVQPDMVTFTADGSKVLSANEGEPRDGYEGVDPMGTITVADLSNLKSISSKTITFENWDAKREELTAAGVVLKKNTAPSVDLEPEYIAVNKAGTRAYVALQEANAIAIVDLATNTVTSIKSLGFKDHNEKTNALDMAKDDKINIQNEEVYGIYMPDGITVYEVNGVEYLLTANEGDSREWGDYLNEVEVKINGEKVVTLNTTDYDGLNPEATYLFGGRSFSIYNAETMEQVYDSGSDFEEKTAKYLPEYFNCSNDKISMDNRSGKKGPEPESIVVGMVGDKSYAFIGLERIGGVMVYDITDPANASFVNYINSRDFSNKIAGDVSPEGLAFVSAAQSFSGNAELFVANEVSGTVAIYELKGLITESDKAETEDNQNPTDKEETEDNQNTSDKEETEDDQKPSDKVETEENQSSKDTVKTGDNSQIGMLFGAVILSIAVMIVSLNEIKKRV